MPSTASGQIEEVKNKKEFWEIVGLLLADGTVRINKKHRHFELIFAGKEEKLIQVFEDNMKRIFGDLHFTERVDRKQVKIVRVCNKTVVEILQSFIPDWKRKENNNIRLPSIENIPSDNLISFVRSFFSAEGSVILGCKWHKTKKLWIVNKRIQVTVKNESLKIFVKKILEKLGFRPSIWKNEVLLTKKEDILKFAKEIRFLDGVRISKKSRTWFGVEKNKILDVVANLCNEGKNSFHNFEEWKNFVNFTSSRLWVQVSTG
jgi:hypothetical protein